MNYSEFHNNLNFNIKYLDIKYALIQVLMVRANKSLLDVSFNIENKILNLQIVLLEGIDLSVFKHELNRLYELLSEYEIAIQYLFISKSEFNNSKGEWQPMNYSWIGELLFSKAEII